MLAFKIILAGLGALEVLDAIRSARRTPRMAALHAGLAAAAGGLLGFFVAVGL